MTKSKTEAQPKTSPVRIVLVDDHPLLRERLQEVLESSQRYRVCGQADNRANGLQVILQEKPDLAIVDLSLKQSSGLELIKDLKVQCPRTQILVLSMHDEAIYAERALRAGASGYITKQEASSKVIEAIEKVLHGECYLPADISQAIVAHSIGRHDKTKSGGIDLLSDRELDVFRFIARGWSIQKIAEELNLHSKTVETYRSRIKTKLGYQSSPELLEAAISWTFDEVDR